MKPLLFASSAIALMIGAAACTKATSDAQTASYETQGVETPAATPDPSADEYAGKYKDMTRADIQDDTAISQRATFVLAADEILASDLIGASIQNPAGEDIATVADVWVGEDGDTPMLIARKGGVAGVGGTLHAVSFDDAKIVPVAGDDEPDVRVTYSNATLDALPEFKQDGLDDFRLASEIMGTTASLAFSDDLARVNDLVLKTDGEPEYILIADGIAGMDQYVLDADTLRIEQGDGDGTLVIDTDQDAFSKAKLFGEVQ
ncbi:MAG TPA: PRC-barrel domain-containing protein [Hyphomonas sp.]|nr:PRC-barrel domain-containing protein [Hyphomonas sp.]HRX73080.1 PRC-barrel domain-containing protein [Hyphomonas sp.]